MKITLKNSSGQTFTIITNATYPFDTPCIAENGKLYWLNRYNSDACFVDNEQLRYISPCKDKNGNHDIVENFNKSLFDVVDTTDDYNSCPKDRVELHICKNKINKIKEIFNQEGGNAFNDDVKQKLKSIDSKRCSLFPARLQLRRKPSAGSISKTIVRWITKKIKYCLWYCS